MSFRVVHDTGGDSPGRWAANVDVTDVPCPAITCGVNDLNSCHFKVEVPVDFCQRDSRTGAVKRPPLDLPAFTVSSSGMDDALAGGYWLEGMEGMKLVLGAHGWKGVTEHDMNVGPCPTLGSTGLGSYRYWLEGEMEKGGEGAGKPPYRVPLMADVRAVPWNGFTVASTFSGCGGSCLGYRMAGFRVLWANEFVPHARECYLANADPSCVLDGRSIRDVSVLDVMRSAGVKRGELDLLDGSPPCQAFSTAGKRHKGWGEMKRYEGGHEQRNEDLFAEFLRFVRGLRPRTFVAENVSGMAKGSCKGVFLEVLAAMKACGYRVSCRLLDAQWLGVPQRRQRLIFVGVREDLRDAGGVF